MPCHDIVRLGQPSGGWPLRLCFSSGEKASCREELRWLEHVVVLLQILPALGLRDGSCRPPGGRPLRLCFSSGEKASYREELRWLEHVVVLLQILPALGLRDGSCHGFSVRTESVCSGGRGMGTTGGGCEEKIFVSVRLTPLNEREIVRNDVCDWECINKDTIIFKNFNLPLPDCSTLFRSDCSTKEVYEKGAKDVALSVTFMMTGITEYAIADIYDYIEKHNEREFLLKFSSMEIYNESVRDLFSTDSTPLRLLDDPERGTVTEKLTEEPLRDWNHVMELLSICEAQRQIGETALNETSSKSHHIIRLTIERFARQFLVKDYLSTLTADVNFVDLAGSERASQSLSAGTRLKEGCHINRSLLTLGTVICKLRKGRNGHVPFRDSKLTRILQSSLGGNARTAIICTMSPVRSHVEQSRNMLLFASCVKEVTTNAQVNVVISDKALVKHLQRELARLESELRSQGPTFVASHYLALLREKGLQIEKVLNLLSGVLLLLILKHTE
ncbi:Kinesin-like protein KIN-7G, partial [Camellia lanceoleosa]